MKEGEEWRNITRESKEVLSQVSYNPTKNVEKKNISIAVKSTGKIFVRIRCANIWGFGEYSDIVELPAVKKPRRVSTPDESVEP